MNVCLLCVGTADRLFVVGELTTLLDWIPRDYAYKVVLIGGDFNTDLDVANPIS